MRLTLRYSFCIILLLGGLLANGQAAAAQQAAASGTPRPRPGLSPCSLPNMKMEAMCGSYEVFENRASKSGRKIALDIVLLPALNASPAPDPVFFLAGGPGQGAAAIARTARRDFVARIRRERDVVFIDQRGTGKSNPLNCDLNGDKSNIQNFLGDPLPVDKVQSCRGELEKVADLKLYTTEIAVDDLDEVRKALGYDRINLYGGSYGTTVALVYLRRHPARVRSLVLEGVTTPDFKMPLPFAKGAQQAMDQLLKDCAGDEECHAAFPKLREEFTQLLDRLEKGAISFDLTNPFTKKIEKVSLTRGAFTERVRLMLYHPDFSSALPILLHRAYNGDFAPFASASIILTRAMTEQASMGMYLSVTCSESIPFISEKEIRDETSGTFVGEYRVRGHLDACRQWLRAGVAPSFTGKVKSDRPVLMISGHLDPATPRSFAEEASRHLSNGLVVGIPYGTHASRSECVEGVIANFLSRGSAEGLDTSCVGQIRRPPFMVKLP